MAESAAHRILIYGDQRGHEPFVEWLESLKDDAAVARIQARLHRLGHGDFGDSKSLGQGLHELRLKVGPGFRVYYGSAGGRVVVLLGGGTKRTQARDIERALKRWQEWTG